MKKSLQYVKTHQNRFEKELFAWLRIPSVSADSTYKKDVLAAADYVVHQLQKIKMDKVKKNYPKPSKSNQLSSKTAFPIVTAEKIVDRNKPTVLIYGHYDVQPPDPLELWESPPFLPTVRKGRVYARGANDNKGQIFSHIKSVEACLCGGKQLPVNVKFLIEGEEEISSINLPPFVKKNRKQLQADYVLISDTDMISSNIPAITYGLRGLCFLEIMVTGPNRDLHSGAWGGVVPNPANTLTKMLANLTNQHYQIKNQSFYKGIKRMSFAEKNNFLRLPWSLTKILKNLGMKNILTDNKLDFFEHGSALPTFDINGIVSGYTGEGAKTIIPAWAKAKISFRLIPNQDYRQVIKVITQSLQDLLPLKEGLSLKVISASGGNGFVTDFKSPGIQAAQRALEKVFGHKGYCVRSGVSIPIVSVLQDTLKADVVMMGFGLIEDNIHSPNESYSLGNYRRGIESSIHFLHEVAKK